ncbi:hypothetical protein [Nocardioides sp. MH1]|uniref:hypothetical protein n=1 Tax=Nocardioides sp. MH1 TaxID=3242490 RepID=UPI00351FFF11
MSTTKKHRATEPVTAGARTDGAGGAHRSSRTGETVLLLSLGTVLIVIAMVMTVHS